MTEGLFILTTIFVAYVVYQVVNDQKISGESGVQETAKKTKAPVEPPKSQTAAKEEKPAAPKAAAKAAAPAPSQPAAKAAAPAPSQPAAKAAAPAPSQPAIRSVGLRDPKTGEISNAHTNYRFTKRWIKEALVAEGLLPKVYKNNELDADTEANIKAALAKLEALDKYRA